MDHLGKACVCREGLPTNPTRGRAAYYYANSLRGKDCVPTNWCSPRGVPTNPTRGQAAYYFANGFRGEDCVTTNWCIAMGVPTNPTRGWASYFFTNGLRGKDCVSTNWCIPRGYLWTPQGDRRHTTSLMTSGGDDAVLIVHQRSGLHFS